MSDHDAAPDPVDKAYAQAEAVLDDEAARAARRARLLGAIAREVEAPAPAVSPPSRSRLSWRGGGWLTAASVAGLGALLAVRLYPPIMARREPPAQPVAAAPPEVTRIAPPQAATTAPPRATPIAPADRARKPASARDAAPFQRAEPAAPIALPAPPPPPPAAPPASAPTSAEEFVVTGSRIPSAPPPAPAAAKAASGARDAAVPADGAARLRAAAGAGRISELTALLNQGAPVDAADDDGETALMKAVQANHPAAAALLRRRGADLDRKNRAGASARDMATAIGDAALDRALGLVP